MVEKIRRDSLQPGTSVLPLVKSSFLLTSDKLTPIVTIDNVCIGFISSNRLNLFKGSKYLSYTKVDRIRVLRLKSAPVEKILHDMLTEFSKKGISFDTSLGNVTIFPSLDSMPICSLPISYAEFLGSKISRVTMIAYVSRNNNMSLLMGRRVSTALTNPAKLQCLLSFPYHALTISREKLAEIAYKSIDLQPAFYTKLRSTSLSTTMLATTGGYQRISIHTYDIDLTDYGTLRPRCPPYIEQYEVIPIHAVLDSCNAGMVCSHDILAVLFFCIRHGIITPETDDNYELVTQILSYNITHPFPYAK